MGALWGLIQRKEDPKTPIKGCGPRLKNIATKHYRGLLGSLPIFILPWFLEKKNTAKTVKLMWIWMAWFFLLQPVGIPVTGMIPIFVLPMTCAMSSDATCGCYMNEGTTMFILGNMVLLLWNNSGLDRRFILWFLCAGDTPQFSGKRLAFKCCVAAYFLSIFSNKLIVANIMLQYVTQIMADMQASTAKGADANYEELRNILNNAIQTSCSIGGIAILHSSYATIAFRAIFQGFYIKKSYTWLDIFNFLEYSSFAMPLSIVLIICNIIYHIVLVGLKGGKPVSGLSKNRIRNAFIKLKKDIPSKITLHEKITLFFSIVVLALYFTRWNKYFGGWAKLFDVYNNVPGVRDATVAACFAILLHSLPCGFRFIKVWRAKKRSQFGPLKPESGILWWRFVDKNIIYGYIFLIGSGVALSTAITHTKLNHWVAKCAVGKFLSSKPQAVYILIVSFVAVVLSNAMSSVAAIVILLPFVMHVYDVSSADDAAAAGSLRLGERVARQAPASDGAAATTVVKEKVFNFATVYLGALAVGIAGSFGFMNPFLYTPAYFCHYTGKVPRKKMAIYGLGSAIICFVFLWLFVNFYAPLLWVSSKINQVEMRTTTKATTSVAPAPGSAPASGLILI